MAQKKGKGYLSPQAKKARKKTVRSHEPVIQPKKKGGKRQRKGKMTAAEFKRGVAAVKGEVRDPEAVIGAASWGVTKARGRKKKS